MHPKIEEAFQEIDAAVFSSDTFEDVENRKRLKSFIDRWEGEMSSMEFRNSKCHICGGPNH